MKVTYRDRPVKHNDDYSIYLNGKSVANGSGTLWAIDTWNAFYDAIEKAGKGNLELVSYDEDGDPVTLETLELA